MTSHKRASPIAEIDQLLLDETEKSASSRSFGPKRFTSWLARLNWLFICMVVLPTTAATVYYGFIASPIYVSDSSFVVESVQDQEGIRGALGGLLKSSVSSTADQDTENVQEFIQSRDALRELVTDANIRGAYGDSKIDLFSRFGGLRPWDKSFESLYHYYSKRIVDVEPSLIASSITEIQVKAFTPEEACLINSRLLDMGEKLVNQLNERLEQDLVRFAQNEVDGAEKNAEAAYVALADYRNSNLVVDTDQQSALQLSMVQTLQQKLIDTRSQLAEVTRSSANNPQVPALQNEISGLESEIAAEMAKTAGGANSLSTKASEYDKLTLEKEFSEKELTDALTFLENSRNEAQGKELYLKRIVEPNMPDYPMYPKRITTVLAIVVLSLAIWGIVALFVAGVREHQQQ
jgi:capsular polysaccharide transport system permease protein